ncbi:MAG: beta-propeller domain-containing protein [Candidatus Pacearchaeota archaeon]
MKNSAKFITILAVCILIVLITIIFLNTLQQPPSAIEGLKKFNSLQELKDFVKANSYSYGGYGTEMMRAMAMVAPRAKGVLEQAAEYSTTNIQVEGVDEPDIIKNDGKYIYVVSGTKVIIVDAYPATGMKNISEIELNASISELFLNSNKDKLVIFSGGEYFYGEIPLKGCVGSRCIPPTYYGTTIYIYDISNKQDPKLEKNISIQGSYIDSRMIEDYVYVISQKQVNIENPEPPIYRVQNTEIAIPVTDVYYWDYPDTSYVFTSIMAINIDGKTNIKTYLTGYTGTLYVSQDNIYLTHTKYIRYKDYFKKYVGEVLLPLLPEKQKSEIRQIMNSDKEDWEKMQEINELVENYSNFLGGSEKEQFDNALMEAMEEFNVKIQKEQEKTIVHKINIDELEVEYKASGEVPGHVLNQFSMDEHKGNFRITTTTGDAWSGTSLNHLYVLDKDLNIIGRVEDLAKGESIYSTRFLGDKAYVVTFKKVDPLFVIDLKEPSKPKVLGYLKVTGYSDYLHPYDENHIIGVGKEARGGGEQFAWYQGLKLSLFDVSDVANPKEIGKIEIGDRGTDSYALYEHKAFLFDKTRNLLVIPILLAEINESEYQGNIPDNSYGEYVWQGAYVLNIDLTGISLRGKITHSENATELQDWMWYNDRTSVKRSLYIDDILYTISSGKIKANDLDTLDEISELKLPYEEQRLYSE